MAYSKLEANESWNHWFRHIAEIPLKSIGYKKTKIIQKEMIIIFQWQK